MNIKSIITATIALFVSTACRGGTKQEKKKKKGKSIGKKVRVLWCFSHMQETTMQ